MANRIEGVSEKILECAKREFLEKGFTDASLRTISKNAGTTPRSIYTRYSDKEGLFGALVFPALEGLQSQIKKEQHEYHLRPIDEQKNLFDDKEFAVYYDDMQTSFLNHIYDNFDAFKLLVDCSKGTSYANFMDEIIAVNVEYAVKYIELTKNKILLNGSASMDLVEVLYRLLLEGTYEVVRRNMSREDARVYHRQLQRFFRDGWEKLFQLGGE